MKQMLRSQKIRTLVPLFLALLLTFLAVPFSVAAEGEGSATAYPDELLSEFATFDAADKVAGNHTASNRTDFESKAPNKSVVRGADDKTALLAADDASKTTGGLLLNTGLPFSTASAVAIEFYLKVSNVIPDSTNLYFGIMTSNSGDAPTSRASVGFTLRGDGTRVGYLDGWNIRSADCSEYLWNTDVNRDDGYTRFVMTYNNGDVKVYCGDSSVVLLSHNYSSQEWKEPFNAQLYLTVGVHGKAEDTTDSSFNLSQIKGKTVANLKDISVYSGALTPTEIDALYQKITPAVRFEKNGRLLDIRKPVNGTLTVDSFPNIESDQTVCWFNKETGALVQAGTIFDTDTTLVAREYDSNESILLVAQNTTPTDGKAAARFVGGVWDLTGDHVGFDIQVTYTKGSQEVTEKYRKMGSAVYTSVLAAGERRTANELGVMYLFALSFEEIPAQGTITFKLKPFKSSGDKRIYGKGGTFTMTDGEFTEPTSVDEKDFTREDWKLSGVPAYPKGSNTLNADTYACGTTIKNYSQNGHNDTGSIQQTVQYTNLNEFTAYMAKLERFGYRKEYENNIEDNLYASYSNGDHRVYLTFNPVNSTAKVVLDPTGISLEEFGYTYTPKAGEQSEFYQYAIPMADGKTAGLLNCGMNLVIKCADNSVIVIDGGAGLTQQMNEVALSGFNDFLHEITQTPQGEKVRISAWYLTHYHSDHFIGFYDFLSTYGDQYELERVIANIPTKDAVKWDGLDWTMNKLIKWTAMLNRKYPNCKELKVHTGQDIHIADITLRVLYTHEDLLNGNGGFNSTDSNDTSTVIRVDNGKMSMMVLGDANNRAQSVINSTFTQKTLKSDILQAAHHMIYHLETLYKRVAPSVVYIPQSEELSHSSHVESGTTYQWKRDFLMNLVNGNCYFGGNETVGYAVIDGELTKCYHKQEVIGRYDVPGVVKPESEEAEA